MNNMCKAECLRLNWLFVYRGFNFYSAPEPSFSNSFSVFFTGILFFTIANDPFFAFW